MIREAKQKAYLLYPCYLTTLGLLDDVWIRRENGHTRTPKSEQRN